MPLSDLLAGDRFIQGYDSSRQRGMQDQTMQLQQASGLMQLLQAVEKQKMQQQALARQEQYRAALAATGGDPEKQVAVARQFGDPKDVMQFAGQSLDRRAAAEAAKSSLQERLTAQREQQQERLQAQAELARQRSEDQRLSQQERNQARMDMIRLAASLRQPSQGPAPTVKDIIDPTDPSKLISVDVRTYRGGGMGSPGVIGVAGKEPTSARREGEKELGKRQITNIVDQLSGKYDELEKMKAVVDPKQSGIKNIWERAAASGPGQMAAGFVGTKAQAIRDQINNSKPLLMAAIKQASGMSSQQLNSNAELQFYLQAASDPTKSLESNRAALAVLDQTYGLGTGVRASPEAIEAIRKTAPKTSAGGAINAPGVKFLGFE